MSDDLDVGAVETPDISDTSTDAPADESTAGEGTAAEQRAEKIRLKWLKEEEIDDPRQLAERFTEDYEFEFRGPKKQPVKAKWRDIERHVQRSAGAEQAIRAAQQERQQLMQSREWGKKNVHGYLQRYLGIQDPEQWALDVARQRFQQETEIADLMAGNPERGIRPDPIAAQQKLRELERARLTQVQEWEKQEQEARAQQERAQTARRESEQKMAGEMQRAGIPVNRDTMARAARIAIEHRELEIDLTYDQIAAELRKELRNEFLKTFDSEQDWLALLGNERREKLRQLEIEALKKAKKDAKSAAPAPKVQSTPTGQRAKQPADINSLKVKWGGSL